MNNGEFFSEFTAGRVVNPGHDSECSWFLMEEALRLKDENLHKEARGMFIDAIEAGWDREFGSLLYFIDWLGKPPEAYEHDMKLWWPHNEVMIASLIVYRNTGEQQYLDWFTKTLTYCKTYFSDPEYGEWYGYLRRDGQPTQPPCKGSTFKGPFHLPRMLLMVDKILDEIRAKRSYIFKEPGVCPVLLMMRLLYSLRQSATDLSWLLIHSLSPSCQSGSGMLVSQ